MVWDRCNYSDNIRAPALPPLQSSLPGWRMRLGHGNAATLHCPSLPLPLFLFALIFCSVCPFFRPLVYPYMNSFAYLHIFIFFLLCKNTCSYIHPYLVLFVKQNLFQWDRNQMTVTHAVTVQLLIVPPHPSLFID